MQRRMVMAAICLLSGAACTPYAWYRAGSSERDFRIERAQCNERANSISGAGIIQRDAVFQNCMEGKGWEWKPQR
jgi:hypothetical protein